MRATIAESITNTIEDLYTDGIVDEITMKNIKSLCIPEIEEYSPKRITDLRKHFKLSQAAMAKLFNMSASTIQKWEQGLKKPVGASKKLLDIAERKGLEALM